MISPVGRAGVRKYIKRAEGLPATDQHEVEAKDNSSLIDKVDT